MAGAIPEWVVSLSGGGRDASWLLLDTQEGTIMDFIQQEPPERDEPGQEARIFGGRIIRGLLWSFWRSGRRSIGVWSGWLYRMM